MILSKIINAIKVNRINITQHARQEAKNDQLKFEDILFATISGKIIKEYINDKPYPSCLISGYSPSKTPIHAVWAYDDETNISILVTTYIPNPKIWIHDRERKPK